MGQIARIVVANIIVAIAYYITGQFTLTLSLPPSGAAPLWAPSGIALAAVLIWGYRLLPGIFLGDYLVGVNLVGLDSVSSIALCVLLGTQAAIHAGIGRWLLVQFKVWPSILIKDGDILKFFLLAGVVSTFFPAALTVAVELQIGFLTQETWLESFIIWWIGGALGVVVFIPVMLILFAQPRSIWRARFFNVALPMTVLFIMLVITLHGARDIDDKQIAQRFNASVQLANSLIESELEVHSLMLKSIQTYFQNIEEVTGQEFESFLQNYSEHKNDIFAVAWVEYLTDKNRIAYEQKHGYPITQVDIEKRSFVPAVKQQDYYVTKYVRTPDMDNVLSLQNPSLIGVNVCASQQYQDECQQFDSTKKLRIAKSFFDGIDPDADQRFLHIAPVLLSENKVKGLIVHVFEYKSLFDSLLLSVEEQWVEVTLTDLSNKRILYSSLDGEITPVKKGSHPLIAQKIITIADRQWQLEFTPSKQFIETYSSWAFYWVITSALILLSLIGTWLMTLAGREQLIKQEVAEKTYQLSQNVTLLEKSEEKYRHLVENIKDNYLIYSHDRKGIFTYISPSIEHLLGYSPDEFLQHYSTYMPDTEINRAVEGLTEQTLSGGDSASYEIEIIDKWGELHTLEVTEYPSYDNDDNIIGVDGIAHDITESKKSRVELEKLSLAIQHNSNAIVITDREGKIEHVNPKFTQITGYTDHEIVNKWPDIIRSSNTMDHVYKDLWDTVLSGHEWRGEVQNKKQNGDLYWARELVAPMLDEKGNVTHIVITQEDVTEARRLSKQTSYQASHDLLTGLINRREFELRLDRVISAAKRDLTEHAVCFLDLDRFKIINDTCGHVAGDELLRQLGVLMQNNTRQRDTLARLGGDEFGLLMEHCSIEKAYSACEQIITLLEDFRFHWEDRIFTLGASIGLAVLDQHIKDGSEVIMNADFACYAAKNLGRNQVQVHTDDHARLQQRKGEIQWNKIIKEALEDNSFLLYVQEIKSLKQLDKAIDYEVLLRLQMPDESIVPPGAFLPAADRYNSIIDIDRWVVKATLNWISKHAEQLNHINTFAINLSGKSMGDEAMLGFIIKQFEQGDVPPEKIKFEITETEAITNLRDATVFIKTLHDFGCRFALDDFGSGLSSFAYLKNLKVDYLKIDGMFVKGMLDNPIDYEMVKAINDIGHVMGLETIAEFAESHEVLDKLTSIGIDYAQGYILGEPAPIDSLLSS